MGNKEQIAFIVNPFSGVFANRFLEKQLDSFLDGRFGFGIFTTEYQGHAISLAKELIEKGYKKIIAVGGDGTVNEVAESLIGSDVDMGVIPGGSGNGFYRAIGNDVNVRNAIGVINEGKILRVDTGIVNEKPFVNVSGIGFSGLIANAIDGSRLRGVLGYGKFILRHAFGYKEKQYEIIIDGVRMETSAFIIDVANGPFYGYNYQIAPNASIIDGLFDVVIIKKDNKRNYIKSLMKMMSGDIYKCEFVDIIRGRDIEITVSESEYAHVDGTGIGTDSVFVYQMIPNSLNLIVPEDYGKKE